MFRAFCRILHTNWSDSEMFQWWCCWQWWWNEKLQFHFMTRGNYKWKQKKKKLKDLSTFLWMKSMCLYATECIQRWTRIIIYFFVCFLYGSKFWETKTKHETISRKAKFMTLQVKFFLIRWKLFICREGTIKRNNEKIFYAICMLSFANWKWYVLNFEVSHIHTKIKTRVLVCVSDEYRISLSRSSVLTIQQ